MNNQVFVASFLIPGIFSIIILASIPSISEIQSLYGSNAKDGIIAANTNDIHNLHQDINHNNNNYAKNNECISYDASEKSIIISCGSVHLTDIANQINEQNVIKKESDGNWLLNAGIIIEKGAMLILDPQDTKWLKIIADGTNAYPITVLGSLKIDSVKVTSCNPLTNGYAISKGNRELNDALGKYEVTEGFPRPYIRIEEDASGNANITNSEIAYLGYEAGLGEGKTGLIYLPVKL